MADPTYPLDTTGTASSNLVTGERHTLTEINSATQRILIPTFSPFYLRNFVLGHVATDGTLTPMVEGSDYYFVLPYMVASRSVGQPVYGGIAINTLLTQGSVELTYQTLGGPWCADVAYVYERLLEAVYNARTTWWDTLTNVQDVFPPTAHSLPVSDIDGITDLIEKMEAIRLAILENPSTIPPALLAHVLATGNPHGLTKVDIGLSNVQNLEYATDEEVLAKASLDKVVTLRQILLLLP